MNGWQEEYLLALAISAAVSVLIVTLTEHNAQDYVFAGFFLICSTCFLKLNWLRGAVPQLIPLVLVNTKYVPPPPLLSHEGLQGLS